MQLPPHLQLFVRLQQTLIETRSEGEASNRPFQQMAPIAEADNSHNSVSPSRLDGMSANNHGGDINERDKGDLSTYFLALYFSDN
jgi:hypothetical protein